ncbi:unnamed protein product [Leptosia nina]|uniref:Uncharacterized protein n=1 Tax=Leptosia nina TaxID=320188 RepID=A0AAV1JXX3_9NEOP
MKKRGRGSLVKLIGLLYDKYKHKLYEAWVKVKNFFKQVYREIKKVFQKVGRSISNFFNKLFGNFKKRKASTMKPPPAQVKN